MNSCDFFYASEHPNSVMTDHEREITDTEQEQVDGEPCDLEGDMNTWDSHNAKDAANSMMTHLERETVDTEKEEGRDSYLNFNTSR